MIAVVFAANHIERRLNMQVTLTLSEKEIDFLKKLMASRNRLEGKEHSIEDVIHECIKMTMFDEGEHGVSAT